MGVEKTAIAGVFLIRPPRFEDSRGFVSEAFNESWMPEMGITHGWVQDNHSYSVAARTLRGLHFQKPPYAQAKLIRVVRGAILDVVVDIRRGSPTFGRHVAAELSRENWTQLYAPAGFAHGFITLTGDADVIYKVSAPYNKDSEGGLLWNDPALAIDWPAGEVVIKDVDTCWPGLADLPPDFLWQGS